MREKLLKLCFKNHMLEDDVDMEYMAHVLHGKTGANIEAKCNEAICLAMEQYPENHGSNTDNLVG